LEKNGRVAAAMMEYGLFEETDCRLWEDSGFHRKS
jgi:hypothetical protein